MNAILTIAAVTARGLLRPKVIVWFFVIVVFMLFGRFVGMSTMLEAAAAEGETEASRELIANTASQIFSFAVFGIQVTAFFLGAYAFPSERKNRTVVAILAHPVSRFELVIGKVLGLIAPVWGMLLALFGLLLVVLAILGTMPLSQTYLGLATALSELAFVIALAAAIGLHQPALVALGVPIAFNLLTALRENDMPVLHYLGEFFRALAPADAPRDLISTGFGQELLELDVGLYLAVAGENLLYGLTILAASVWLFLRRDIRLGDG